MKELSLPEFIPNFIDTFPEHGNTPCHFSYTFYHGREDRRPVKYELFIDPTLKGYDVYLYKKDIRIETLGTDLENFHQRDALREALTLANILYARLLTPTDKA